VNKIKIKIRKIGELCSQQDKVVVVSQPKGREQKRGSTHLVLLYTPGVVVHRESRGDS